MATVTCTTMSWVFKYQTLACFILLHIIHEGNKSLDFLMIMR